MSLPVLFLLSYLFNVVIIVKKKWPEYFGSCIMKSEKKKGS